MHKFERGFALLMIVLLIAAVAIILLVYQIVDSSKLEQKEKDESRPFKSDISVTPQSSQSGQSPNPTSNPVTVSSTPKIATPTKNPKIELKTSSYGEIDLGGGFTARLISAWEQYNMVYIEIILTNNYDSLLGLNTNEFTLRGDKVITKPATSKEIGLNPGEIETIILIFNKLPSFPNIVKYDHPVSHIVFELGTIDIK